MLQFSESTKCNNQWRESISINHWSTFAKQFHSNQQTLESLPTAFFRHFPLFLWIERFFFCRSYFIHCATSHKYIKVYLRRPGSSKQRRRGQESSERRKWKKRIPNDSWDECVAITLFYIFFSLVRIGWWWIKRGAGQIILLMHFSFHQNRREFLITL